MNSRRPTLARALRWTTILALAGASAFAVEERPRLTIDFDAGWPQGEEGRGILVREVSPGSGMRGAVPGGTCFVGLSARARSGVPEVLMTYDTTCENGCTGGDTDLQQHDPPFFNSLIISEHGPGEPPDDAVYGGVITFDFCGAVQLEEVRIKDSERGGGVRLYRGSQRVARKRIPQMRDGEWRSVRFAGATGITRMEVELPESGAVDEVVFVLQELSPWRPIREETLTLDELLAGGPRESLTEYEVDVQAPFRGGWPMLIDFELQESADVHVHLRSSGGGRPREFDARIEGRAGRTLEVLEIPSDFGDDLIAGRVAVRASSGDGEEPLPLRLHGIGAGEKIAETRAAGEAVTSFRRRSGFALASRAGATNPSALRLASIPKGRVTPFGGLDFKPRRVDAKRGENARFEFQCHSAFDAVEVKIWRKEGLKPVRTLEAPRACRLGGGSYEGEWDGRDDRDRISKGRHYFVVSGWDGAGPWLNSFCYLYVDVVAAAAD